MVFRSIRIAAASAALLAATVVAAPVAFAGEVNGKGEETPIGRYEVPASVCAFSGLNDYPDGSDHPADPFAPGKVQNWGDIIQEVAGWGPGSVPGMKDVMQAMKPGISCNKNRGGEH